MLLSTAHVEVAYIYVQKFIQGFLLETGKNQSREAPSENVLTLGSLRLLLVATGGFWGPKRLVAEILLCLN